MIHDLLTCFADIIEHLSDISLISLPYLVDREIDMSCQEEAHDEVPRRGRGHARHVTGEAHLPSTLHQLMQEEEHTHVSCKRRRSTRTCQVNELLQHRVRGTCMDNRHMWHGTGGLYEVGQRSLAVGGKED
jgi:hypothetical protein